MFELTVVQAFGAYQKGAAITDPAEVAAILASENESRVIKVPLGTHPVEVATVPAPDLARRAPFKGADKVE